MTPRILCHNHTLTEAERELIESKISRLRKYYERIAEVSVLLDSTKRTALAEILTSGPHLNLRFKEEAEDMRTAFEGAINKAERGLQRTKEKKYGDKMHRRRNITIRRFNPVEFDFARDFEESAASALPHLAHETVEPRSMTLEEAYNQLESQQKGLLVFFNTQSERINILHRNGGNELELVEIENAELASPEEYYEVEAGK